MRGYYAKDNEVWVEQADGKNELFLTVHPTSTGEAMVSLETQATVLADILNAYCD